MASGLLERFKRPFRGSPSYEKAPIEDALSLITENFNQAVTDLENIPDETRITTRLHKDESWKFIMNAAQAIDVLFQETPRLAPSPTLLKAAGLANKVLKEIGEEPVDDSKIPAFLTGKGFEETIKPRELKLPSATARFFGEKTKNIKIVVNKLEVPIYDESDRSWLGYGYHFELSLINEEFKRLSILTYVRHLRPNVSLTDPRENLTFLFPRQDTLQIDAKFYEQLGPGPTILAADQKLEFSATGDKRMPITQDNALLLASVLSFVLRKWSTRKELQDIRNW